MSSAEPLKETLQTLLCCLHASLKLITLLLFIGHYQMLLFILVMNVSSP